MDTIIYGGDSETLEGRPMTFQFYSKMAGTQHLLWVKPSTATRDFLAWCETLHRDANNVMYVHNLAFDLPEFLWECKEALVENTGGEYGFEYGEWEIRGVYGKPTFCRLHNRAKHVRLLIVDSMAWYQGSLDAAASLFCPELPKLAHPEGLGSKQFSKRDTAFCEYAMRDSEVAYAIGCAVQEIHHEFDIKQAVSLADMSAKIFRHHFLKYIIPQPPTDYIRAALASYHGGKNNVIPGAAPAWHLGVSAFDISSAYPYAMSELPAFDNARGYKRLGKKVRSIPARVPEWGVYQISGTAADSAWPSIFSHGFTPIRGKFRDVWVHGLEVNRGLDTGSLRLSSIRGYYYDPDSDRRDPALQAFVADFYERKQSQADKVMRHMYKIVLNALYGKFIQTRKNARIIYTDVDANETEEVSELVAGGMFHPFIASSITAHTRAYMHEIETAHKAIHTATDGIYTYRKTIARIPGRPRSGLGSLEVEGRGDLLLFRNKCYILYSEDGGIESQAFAGKRIAKFAKHGFQGSVHDLEQLAASNRRKYKTTRPNRLRESIKRGLDVNRFVEKEHILKVAPIGVASPSVARQK